MSKLRVNSECEGEASGRRVLRFEHGCGCVEEKLYVGEVFRDVLGVLAVEERHRVHAAVKPVSLVHDRPVLVEGLKTNMQVIATALERRSSVVGVADEVARLDRVATFTRNLQML